MLLDGKHIFNVAGDEIISIKELSNLISKHMKSEPIFEYTNDMNIIDLIGDNTKIKKMIGIRPKISLEEGIKNILGTWS